MPIWLDDNNIKGELLDALFAHEVAKLMKERVAKETKEGRPGNYGNDGNVLAYEEAFNHAGVNYLLNAGRMETSLKVFPDLG